MTILFLHGLRSVPGGVKPSYLKGHGHEVINPALDDNDFDAALAAAQAEFDKHKPKVVVGSSRGGAVAMNINSGDAKLVLLCPAWKKWGTATSVGPDTVILHSRADDVIPFTDSEELVRNSGLPASALVEVGNDHRLAESVPLKALLAAVNLAFPILCLGIDVAWWGGLRNQPDSQRDTIIYTTIGGRSTSNLNFVPVDLSAVVNPRCDEPTEPNRDSDGGVLGKAIASVIKEHQGKYSRCVLALDTPVEVRSRANQPARIKAPTKGQKTGAERRQCERELESFKKGLSKQFAGTGWNKSLYIQSGSPVSPRMSSVLQILTEQNGFSFWRKGHVEHGRQIIEVFPSEAIWSLGIQGRYINAKPVEVRAYKKGAPSLVTREMANQQAKLPLAGFQELLELPFIRNIPVRRWIEQIADHACSTSSRGTEGMVSKGKGFDDPIESGIAMLTSVAFAVGIFHAWGDGSDGTIVGPGKITG